MDILAIPTLNQNCSDFIVTLNYVPDLEPTDELHATWRNSVINSLNGHLSILTFVDSIVYDAQITHMSDQNGNEVKFFAGHMGHQKTMDYKRINALNINLKASEWSKRQLHYALQSYRSMLDPSNRYIGLFFAIHTLEAIRKNWQEPEEGKLKSDKKDKDTWLEMRKALNIQQELLETITQHTNQRHGGHIESDIEHEAIQAAHQIVDVVLHRFLLLLDGALVQPTLLTKDNVATEQAIYRSK